MPFVWGPGSGNTGPGIFLMSPIMYDEHRKNVRTSDPHTSKKAAYGSGPDRYVTAAVLDLMGDGIPRIAEEIEDALQGEYTPQRCRCGIKRATEEGLLGRTKAQRRTRLGGLARERVMVTVANGLLFPVS